MARIFWTDKEREILAAIIKKNGTIKDCVRILNRSQSAIFNEAYRMGLSLSQTKEIDMAAFKQFLKEKGE